MNHEAKSTNHCDAEQIRSDRADTHAAPAELIELAPESLEWAAGGPNGVISANG